MKALKDCHWRVRIYRLGEWCWDASTTDRTEIYDGDSRTTIEGGRYYSYRSSAMQNWKSFAKKNEFKHWNIEPMSRANLRGI